MWRIQGQVSASFWFGLNSYRRGLLDGLPGGFQPTPEVRDIEKSHSTPPRCIEFSGMLVSCQLQWYVITPRKHISTLFSKDIILMDEFFLHSLNQKSLFNQAIGFSFR